MDKNIISQQCQFLAQQSKQFRLDTMLYYYNLKQNAKDEKIREFCSNILDYIIYINKIDLIAEGKLWKKEL